MNRVKSSKPKKQRKQHYSMPLHRKQNAVSAHLDKKLRKQFGCRSIAIRKNDTVKVMRGKKKGSTGKITGVNYEKGVVFIEKLVRKKANGEEIPLPVQASNLLITDIDRNDAKRLKGKKIKLEPVKAVKEEKPKEKEEKKEKKEVKAGEKGKKEEKKKDEAKAGKKPAKGKGE